MDIDTEIEAQTLIDYDGDNGSPCLYLHRIFNLKKKFSTRPKWALVNHSLIFQFHLRTSNVYYFAHDKDHTFPT